MKQTSPKVAYMNEVEMLRPTPGPNWLTSVNTTSPSFFYEIRPIESATCLKGTS